MMRVVVAAVAAIAIEHEKARQVGLLISISLDAQ